MDDNQPGANTLGSGDDVARRSDSIPQVDGSFHVPVVEAGVNSDHKELVDKVLYSDIGVSTLLNRLKQSIASAQDFSGFLKKRSAIEESHAQGLKKLYKTTHDVVNSPNVRGGTYSLQFDNASRLQDRMGDNGMQFALSLHQMHEDLSELGDSLEKGRKKWKGEGLANEKKVQDAESAMHKAKSKYDGLAEDLDRLKTGDKSSGKIFGLKGPKSAAQQEEDLQRKMQAADTDYAAKVQNAKDLRQELVNSQRPQAVKALVELIKECDSALSLQFQKYVAFNEKLILGNGILVAPMPGPNGEPTTPSMQDHANQVNNEKDLDSYILSHLSKVPAKVAEIKYIKHPSLVQSQSTPAGQPRPSQPQIPQQNTSPSQAGPPKQFPMHVNTQQHNQSNQPTPVSHDSPYRESPHRESPYQDSPYQTQQPPYPVQQPSNGGSYHNAPPQLGYPQTGTSQYPAAPAYSQQAQPSYTPLPSQQASGVMYGQHENTVPTVFPGNLQRLAEHYQTPVPMIVYQCIQAVEMFGLEMEGIYRIPGTKTHIDEMKVKFNRDPNSVDFRNPASFQHDINSVAGLLKKFFGELEDPLFTRARYQDFIKAARIDDEIVRRDSMHKIINELPDPNYATIRAVVLHLNRIQENASVTRMTSTNLAICFAPTLMMGDIKQHTGQLADAGLQARVIETVLSNTLQIFDED